MKDQFFKYVSGLHTSLTWLIIRNAYPTNGLYDQRQQQQQQQQQQKQQQQKQTQQRQQQNIILNSRNYEVGFI